MVTRQFTSTTCPACQTGFEHVPVEQDEDGYSYAALEIRPCHHPSCDTLLCPCCDQFHCEECGELFCVSHLVSIPDSTGTPLHCCPTCAAECDPAVYCAVCESNRVSVEAHDFGTERETGYQDAGERYHCKACGADGDSADLVRQPVG